MGPPVLPAVPSKKSATQNANSLWHQLQHRKASHPPPSHPQTLLDGVPLADGDNLVESQIGAVKGSQLLVAALCVSLWCFLQAWT